MKLPARQFGILVLLTTGLAQAADKVTTERWEVQAAMAASVDSRSADIRSQLQASLFSGDGQVTLDLLQGLQLLPDLNAVARERTVFEFVEDLRQRPPGSVHPDVLEFLKHYPVTVMVEHHDHPHADEALFDIPAATYGVINHWTRQQAAFEGARMLVSSAAALVQAYLETSDPARRRGYIDSLGTADQQVLAELNQIALKQLDASPELATLAGHSALIAGEHETLHALAKMGSGAGLNEVFRLSAAQLDTEQRMRLLESALSSGRPTNAALAIAHLAADAGTHERTLQLLVGQLEDQQLGAAAALSLSRHPSPALHHILEEIGRQEHSELAASRARLALQLMTDLPREEAPR